jgi:gluconate 2-dehydrogenase gamma chain
MSDTPFWGLTRRVFIHRAAFWGGGVLLFGGCHQDSSAPKGATAGPAVLTTSHLCFTNEEYAVMSAAVDRIIPKDTDPGALDANVPQYIDRTLQNPDLRRMRDDFIDGTTHLDKRARVMFPGRAFVELTPSERDEVIRAYKESAPGTGEAHFYELLVTLTLEGFLGDPSYGGNKDHVGWALVGFQAGEPLPGHAGMHHGAH